MNDPTILYAADVGEFTIAAKTSDYSVHLVTRGQSFALSPEAADDLANALRHAASFCSKANMGSIIVDYDQGQTQALIVTDGDSRAVHRRGDTVYCTNGHPICVFAHDALPDQELDREHFGGFWNGQSLTPSCNPFTGEGGEEPSCAECGAKWDVVIPQSLIPQSPVVTPPVQHAPQTCLGRIKAFIRMDERNAK